MMYEVINLGLVDYQEAYSLQQQLLARRLRDEMGDTILLLEHNPVITLGRRAKRDNILVSPAILRSRGIKVLEVDRGGDVTVHSPGQLVCYPIMDLRRRGKDLHRYLRNLEEAIIRLLTTYGLQGMRVTGQTGIWIQGREKIASIGIGVRNWVTYHGVALNVNNDISYFSLIRPCGLEGVKVTSISRILGEGVDMDELRSRMIKCFDTVFTF
ncbi:MAG TPA: lipoyl(octanoyl) transferase LipB [Candidatus Latescibacteria bacterium]|nr:lipoyl(octanoyl) transferase LipB [Candidatus Latescibacterota bacterium]